MSGRTKSAPGRKVSDGAGSLSAKWLVAAIALAFVGLLLSAYSLKHHLEVKAAGQTDASCNINDLVSCDQVAQSQYSEVAGIPLGAIGFGYFAAVLVVLGLSKRAGKSARVAGHVYGLMVVIGALVSVVLGGISAAVLGLYCLTCIGIYVVCAGQLGVVLANRALLLRGVEIKPVLLAGLAPTLVVAAIILGFQQLRPQLTSLVVKPASSPNTSMASAPGQELPFISETPEDIPVNRSSMSGLGEDYRRGPDDAKVVIQEFADLKCPACKMFADTLDKIVAKYGDQVQIVFRNNPANPDCNPGMVAGKGGHPFACEAAVMARCAGQIGKFWEFVRLVYDNQSSIDVALLRQLGGQVGLSAEQMDTCARDPYHLDKIKADTEIATKGRFTRLPQVFLNTYRFNRVPTEEQLMTAIDVILR